MSRMRGELSQAGAAHPRWPVPVLPEDEASDPFAEEDAEEAAFAQQHLQAETTDPHAVHHTSR